VSEWRVQGGRFLLNLAIPANTQATVYVPAKGVKQVSESGRPARNAEGVHFSRSENGAAVFEVESGRYSFRAEMEK
jgi:alpha-L-rhamnosidase